MLVSEPGRGWSTVRPVVTTTTLVTQDGVPIDAVHLPGPRLGDGAAGTGGGPALRGGGPAPAGGAGGALAARHSLGTRIARGGWDPLPVPPAQAAARISPVPVLIVHGDRDLYFPQDHGRELYDGAREPKELWLLPGFGHAERSMDDAISDRIATWVTEAVASHGATAEQTA